ncbi:MAG: hypothetical protein E7613_02840 [Ruminococcaceae bacterium]|nr:hypothetical protein [Oscillospiraceae bacterium]
MKDIKRIDIHAHVTAFPEYAPPFKWGGRFCSGEEVIKIYDEINVEKGVLLPISAAEGQLTPMTSEAIKYVADKYPDRFLWFCNVDPRAMQNDDKTDFGEILSFYKNMGAKGIGEITCQIYADDPKLDNLYSYAEELDLPVLIHISPKFDFGYGIVDELGLPRIESMLKKHPNLKLIGHSQCFWSEISGDNTDEIRNTYPKGRVSDGRIAHLLREYPNLYCDLSAGSGANAMMRDPDYCYRFFEEFSDRILYGCDICATTNTHQYEFSDFLDKMMAEKAVSEGTYKKIVRDNAVSLLKL